MKNVVGITKNLNVFRLLAVFIFLNMSLAFAGPSRTTYQAKIIKPDGYALEASNVNFKFTIMDPAGTCILYSETYNAVNMSSTGGMISFALGSGVKVYPVSATTFEQVFSNITPTLSCDAGGPPTYSPLSTDIRKIVMQFHDGNGWQTLPAMSINAVPYAMYANEAATLNGKTDADFVEVAGLATCLSTEALHYNGTSFSCVSTASVSAAAVVAALGYTPATGASVTAIVSSLSTTDSTVASVSASVFSVSSTVSSLSNLVTSLENTVAASFVAMTSSQWATSGTTISYDLGSIAVSGGVRLGIDATACAANSAGTLRYNAGFVEYCNGTSWSAFGVAGSGITLMNGSASGSQTFSTGINGTVFNISSVNGVHTFNIPLAASAGVTAGLVSNADFNYLTDQLAVTATSFTTVTNVQATNAASFVAVANEFNVVAASFTTFTNTQATNSASFAAISTSYVAKTGDTMAGGLTIVSGGIRVTDNTQNGGIRSFNSLIIQSDDDASATNEDIIFRTGASESMRIRETGNVGIGTNSPVAKLDVVGTRHSSITPSNAIFKFGGSDVHLYGGAQDGTAAPYPIMLQAMRSSDSQPFALALNPNGGSVGIGTLIPTERLTVSGNISLTNPGANVNRYIAIATNGGGEEAFIRFDQTAAPGPHAFWDVGSLSGNNAYDFGFESSGTRRMTLTFDGKLGVGTNLPTAKLHLASGTSGLAPMKFTAGTLLASPASGSIEYDGTYLYITDSANSRKAILTDTGGNYAINNLTSPGNITMTPTGSVIVSSTTASTNSQTGALIVKGGLGIAGSIYSSGTILTSSNIEGNGVKTKGTSAYLEMHDTDTLYSANPQSALVFRDGGNSQYSFMGPVNGSMLWNSWLPIELDTSAGVDFYLSLTGRVGLGTSSPTRKFSVHDNTDASFIFNYNNGAHALYGGADSNQPWLGTSSNSDLRLVTSGTEKARITSAGYVGIGQQVPTSNLHINTGLSTTNYTGVKLENPFKTWTIGNNVPNNYNNIFGIFDGTTPRLWIGDTGNVGIGSINPTYKFQVQKTASSTPAIMVSGGHAGGPRIQTYGLDADGLAWMGLGTDMSGNNYEHSIYTSGPGQNGKITFGQYDGSTYTERMRVHGNGNVGIGTSTPTTSKLEIRAATLGPNWNDTVEMQRMISLQDNTSYLDFRQIRTASGTNWFSAGARLQHKIDFTWMGYMQFNGDGNDGGITFGTGQTTIAPGNTTERLRITQTGYVGIGTTTPSEMLEVSGSVKATAYLYTSDERLKKEIITLPDALEKALKLRGVNFVWKNNNEKTIGFIAQEVEAVYPELVKTDKVSGYKAVQYGNIVAILVEALKEEHAQRVRSIASVEEKTAARMNQLEKENQELKARLEKIEKFLNDKVK